MLTYCCWLVVALAVVCMVLCEIGCDGCDCRYCLIGVVGDVGVCLFEVVVGSWLCVLCCDAGCRLFWLLVCRCCSGLVLCLGID